VAASHGLKDISAEALNRQFAEAWRALKDFNHTRSEWAGLVQATFRGLADEHSPPEFFGDLYARFGLPGAWRVFDDVIPTLETLASRGMKLGVISNWDERLRPLLRQLKLYDYFETIVVSHEVGFPKPSPVIFQHAAEKLAVAPGAILHVGDSLEMDVTGAHGAGLGAVELRRDAIQASPHQVKSLLELEALLA